MRQLSDNWWQCQKFYPSAEDKMENALKCNKIRIFTDILDNCAILCWRNNHDYEFLILSELWEMCH